MDVDEVEEDDEEADEGSGDEETEADAAATEVDFAPVGSREPVPLKQIMRQLVESGRVEVPPDSDFWPPLEAAGEEALCHRKMLAMYFCFLKNTVHSETSLSQISELSLEIIQDFFGEPHVEPQFMSFNFASGDLGKIAHMLRVNLVVFWGQGGRPRKYVDTRLLTHLRGGSVCEERTFYFRLERRPHRTPQASLLSGAEASPLYNPRLSEQMFISGRNALSAGEDFCYADALFRLADAEPPPDLPRCESLSRLLLALSHPDWPGREALNSALGDRRIVLATHFNTKYAVRETHFRPQNQTWQVLCSFPGSSEVRSEVLPVCISFPNFMFL